MTPRSGFLCSYGKSTSLSPNKGLVSGRIRKDRQEGDTHCVPVSLLIVKENPRHCPRIKFSFNFEGKKFPTKGKHISISISGRIRKDITIISISFAPAVGEFHRTIVRC